MSLEIEDQYNPSNFKLAAINVMLQTIGEEQLAPDDDISSLIEASTAESILIEAKMAVLSEKWDINTDENFTLAVDQDGYINVPTNILDLTADSGDIVIRDWQLYSRERQSRKFTESVKCDIVWNMDFNTLTHPVRYYITIRAARIFQARTIGDTSVYQFSRQDEADAKMAAKLSNGFTGQYNMLKEGHGNDFKVLS